MKWPVNRLFRCIILLGLPHKRIALADIPHFLALQASTIRTKKTGGLSSDGS
nr:hypothetical protein [Plesiomonas shigelloides]